MPLRMPRRAGLLLRTGQTTQYGGMADDGNLQKGLTKRYEILTTGGYSGTKNLDMQALATASDISFVAATKTIAQVAALLAVIKTADVITITGGPNDGAVLTVAAGNTAVSFTVNENILDMVAGTAITIKKREAHSNNCVLDLNTGLTWNRYVSNSIGSASNGKLLWATDAAGQGVFAYAALANTALLAGYADWYVPNIVQLFSIHDAEAPTGLPDSTAFPGWPADDRLLASTTDPAATTAALNISTVSPYILNSGKTADTRYVVLVRGN